MKTIRLNDKYTAMVDDADYEHLAASHWHAHVFTTKEGIVRNVYAERRVRIGTRIITQKMHRLILGVTNPKARVDHRDCNGLNNQRYNLRPATNQQNNYNRRKFARGSSRFKGVSWSKHAGKWKAGIKINKKDYNLGYFTIEEDAAREYNLAASQMFGEYALLNQL